MKNYYEILEVHPKASHEVIEKAYRVLVKKNHPDLSGDNIKIQEINEAYEILSNSFYRKQYDLELENQKQEKINKEIKNNKAKNVNRDNIKSSKQEKSEKPEEVNKKNNVGTIGGILEILGTIFQTRKALQNQPKKSERERKQQLLAILITLVLMIVICVIAWFIPFTNQFMRDLTVNNPLISWMF